MAAVSPAPNRWLFGPIPDLLLGCGLLYAAVFLVFVLAGPQLRGLGLAVPLALAVLLFSIPHYGATLLRVYERREDRRSYRIFSVWATALVVGLFLGGVSDALVASLLVTLYLTWSPWHYTGQNYGLAVMFLRRRGVDLPPHYKRWVYASFLLSFLLTATVMHSAVAPGYDPLAYAGKQVIFLPLGIPATIANVMVAVIGCAYLAATAVAGVLLLRGNRFGDIAPVAALALTQALWFSAPFVVRYFGWHTGLEPIDQMSAIRDYTLMVALGHAIQYLWVTSYYAHAAERWRGYGNFWLKALAGGSAVWVLPLPFIALPLIGGHSVDAGMGLLLAAVVNIHHFILDGAIWKLRNTRIANVLIRSGDGEGASSVDSPWMRRAVWAVAGVGLLLSVMEFYELRIACPAALRQQEWARAGAILDRLAWVGLDRGNRRARVGVGFEKSGDLATAAHHYARSAELRPRAIVWKALGSVEERQEHWNEAVAAYEAALALDPDEPWVFHGRLADIARRRGDCADAIARYRGALRLRPESRRYANDLAWALATCPDAERREPEESVRLAEQARDSAEEPSAHVLDTLAAAYASAGRFEEAVSTARRAVELADASGDDALVQDIGSKLDLYRSGRAFVEEPSIHGG